MSTIPFVQLKGFLALPHLRPLALIPPPFGYDWKLLPPRFGLHTEIHALYAAITRTACLGTRAFLKPRPGDALGHDLPAPPAALVGAAVKSAVNAPPIPAETPAASPSANAPADAVAARVATQPAAPKALQRKLVRRAKHRTRRRLPGSRKIMGGACAIGGAALLAWIVASHAPTGGDTAKTSVAALSDHRADDRVSQRLFAERAAPERVIAATPPPRIVRETAEPSSVASLREGTPASATPASANRPNAFAADNRAGSLRRLFATEPAIASREGRVSGAQSAEHVAPTTRPSAAVAAAHRTGGTDSPRAPAAPPDDDYASIVAYARTVAAARPAVRSSMPVDSTEWVGHVSQRRVTEIPERFME